MPFVFLTAFTFQLKLPSYFRTAAQLGIFRKTGIKAQFRIDWLRSKYRTSEWCYNVEFLRVEGYTPGEYLQLTTKFCKTYEVFVHFFPPSSSGTKHTLFDTTPKGFIPLAPGFWELHNWKAAVFMHHGVDILEQVSYHCFILHYLFFCIMCIHVFFLGFCRTARRI